MNNLTKSKKNQYIPISVLDLPPKNQLKQIITNNPQSDYILYKLSDKKLLIEAYKTLIQRAKLFTNVEIYEWRRQTQFPIAKTYFVNIKSNLQSSNSVELVVYNEHCPLRFDSISQLSLPQIIYILKEALIGFERLLYKFGLFHISSPMIKFNEKGFCRVWINQNFGQNTITNVQKSQSIMLNNILQIIQKQDEQGKGIKLFSKLKQCKTLIGALKQIQQYIASSRILVPNRLVINQTQRSTSPETPKGIKLNFITKSKNQRFYQNVCNSTIANHAQDFSGSFRFRKPISLQKPIQRKSQSPIKKIKSFQSLAINEPHKFTYNSNVYNIPIMGQTTPRKNKCFGSNIMKVSHQTAYTRNINNVQRSSINKNYNSPRQRNKSNPNMIKISESDRFLTGKFNESLKLNSQGQQFKGKQKKDLSYSQANINPQLKMIKKVSYENRSSSRQRKSNNFGNNLDHSFTIGQKNDQFQLSLQNKLITKASDEFNNILNDDPNQFPNVSPNQRHRHRESELESSDEEQKFIRASHTSSVMKNNGWKFNGILEAPKELNQSFHEGKEENAFLRQFKLEKLQSLGRRPAAMSILPEEYQQLF